MSISVERIKELLGNGLSNEVVATAVGVDPSYVTQLMGEDKFREEVIALRATSLAGASTRDNSWNSVEDKLLTKLHETIDTGMIYKTQDVIKVLAIANAAKRRGNPVQDTALASKQVVILNLPTVVVNSYKKNIDGEVIEVTTPEGDQQTLVTMPAGQLMRQLANTHQGDKKYEEVRRYIHGSSEAKNI